MIYVVSDLHGYSLEKFKKLLFDKVKFTNNDTLFVLGDSIDRGMYGIDLLFWMSGQPNIKHLCGNHEWMMLACESLFNNNKPLSQRQSLIYREWEYNGGGPTTIETLRSLNSVDRKKVFSYVKSFPFFIEISVNGKEYILCHSGISNFEQNKKLSDYSPEDFLWHRPKTMEQYSDKTVILGHTPTFVFGGEYAGKIYNKNPTWIDVDAGAGYGYPPVILRLDDGKQFTEV